jgi:hypothetical protein
MTISGVFPLFIVDDGGLRFANPPYALNHTLDDEQEPSRNAQILDAIDFEVGVI